MGVTAPVCVAKVLHCLKCLSADWPCEHQFLMPRRIDVTKSINNDANLAPDEDGKILLWYHITSNGEINQKQTKFFCDYSDLSLIHI